MKIQRFVSMSGGKDSGAVYLLMLRRGKPFRAVFADTDNEHPLTYEYVHSLADRTGGPPIEIAKADFTSKFPKRRANLPKIWRKAGLSEEMINDALEVLHPTGNIFLDLCLLRGGFPSSMVRFCTQELKLRPLCDQFYEPAMEEGKFVVSYTGVRAEESYKRALQSVRTRAGKPTPKSLFMPASIKPIFRWSLEDVVRIHAEMGIDINPLYHMGANRVGCWPCINVRKAELRLIASLSPVQIDTLARWERIVTKISKQQFATFLPAKNLSKDQENWTLEEHGIRGQVEWSKTTHGGKQYMLPGMEKDNANAVHTKYEEACEIEGLCE